MLTATKDRLLPATITGSLPRPSWFTENLGSRSFLEAMVSTALARLRAVGRVERDGFAVVVAELHDEADIGRADGDGVGRRAGIDCRESGEGAVAVECAVGQRRIADDVVEHDVI